MKRSEKGAADIQSINPLYEARDNSSLFHQRYGERGLFPFKKLHEAMDPSFRMAFVRTSANPGRSEGCP